MLRLKRLLLVLYLLHGPGQPLDRFPVSPSPCSLALATIAIPGQAPSTRVH